MKIILALTAWTILATTAAIAAGDCAVWLLR